MKYLAAILLALVTATAQADVFTPVGSDQQPTFGELAGTWTANGTTLPTGFQVRLRPEAGTATKYATWALFDTVGSDFFVPYGAQRLTYADWLALPSEGDGFKTYTFLETNPQYPAPEAGRLMEFFLASELLTAGQWSVQTGTLSGSSPQTFAVTAVPEPSHLLPLAGVLPFFWLRRRFA